MTYEIRDDAGDLQETLLLDEESAEDLAAQLPEGWEISPLEDETAQSTMAVKLRSESRHFRVSLVVKGDDRAAYNALATRLNEWLTETIEPPFPTGALLFWSSGEDEQ